MPSVAERNARIVEAAIAITLARHKALESDKYALWRKRYYDDPAGFVIDNINWREGEGPAPYQLEIATRQPIVKRQALRGPHALGKTAIVSWMILHFALTRDGDPDHDWKILTTASAWRQLTHYLWPEIHKWARRLRWDYIGRPPFDPINELHLLSLNLNNGSAFAVASNNSDLIEGAHADRLLYIFDEAKAIPDDTFNAAEGALSTGEAMALAVSTPGDVSGRFYDIHQRKPGYEDWHAVHITLEECIAAGRVDAKWAADRKAQWGEGSAVYQNRVLGNFASSDEDSVIPLTWVEAANERWQAWMAENEDKTTIDKLGVDVARSGEDKTVYAHCRDWTVLRLEHHSKQDTMVTTGQVAALLKAYPNAYAMVDVLNMGSGVVDRLLEQKMKVHAFNAAEKPRGKDRAGILGFVNKRDEAWWHLREMLDPAYGPVLALPPDDKLIGDLTAPKWTVTSSGDIKVESKEEIAKRIGRSTDDGDAVMMAFYKPKPRGVFLA